MSPRSFCRATYCLLILFIALNWILWSTKVADFSLATYNCGDIARMATDERFSECRLETRTLSRRAEILSPRMKIQDIPIDRYKSESVVFAAIGDSISRGRGGGANNYWQDWLAAESGEKIGLVPEISNDQLLNVLQYINSGYLSHYNVENLILQVSESNLLKSLGSYQLTEAKIEPKLTFEEIVENVATKRNGIFPTPGLQWEALAWDKLKSASMRSRLIASGIQFLYSVSGQQLLWIDQQLSSAGLPSRPLLDVGVAMLAKDSTFSEVPRVGMWVFATSGVNKSLPATWSENLQWILTRLGRHSLLRDDSYHFDVQSAELRSSLFTNNTPKTLHFLLRDWKVNRDLRDSKRLVLVHNNLNVLSSIAERNGIQLWFMPTPSKLTAYQSMLVKPIETPSTSLERLRGMPGKRYVFVDTLTIIRDSISRGATDVYFGDDTHWTSKVLPAIARHIMSLKMARS